MPSALLLLALLLDHTLAWSSAGPGGVPARRIARPASPPPLMMAKSKKPRRKPKPSAQRTDGESSATAGLRSSLGSPEAGPSRPSSDAPVEERVAKVLRDAGLSNTGGFAAGPAQPADPLARIPKKGQELLERFFAGGALLFGSVFLTSGICVSVEALCKVLGSPLPVAVDEALVQYVEPALTPSILILFGFSISLGVLKQLQLGSASAGVLYTEEDD
mmetsp:Transcript_30812/g.76922  ORF Transcript_30812/g.76922 Transcript_30812/m.76922 type:complete len:218 (+) Transcript_30812:27-680(+)